MRLGLPAPACPGALRAGWGLNCPLHQLWRRRLSQTQQIWACPGAQAPRIGRGWKCVQLTASGRGAWQDMGWEQGADSQRPRESRKLQGFARGSGPVPEGGAGRFLPLGLSFSSGLTPAPPHSPTVSQDQSGDMPGGMASTVRAPPPRPSPASPSPSGPPGSLAPSPGLQEEST